MERHEKLGDFLNLICELQNRRQGMTLEEFQDVLGTGRRSAERARDLLSRVFTTFVEGELDGRRKRWRFDKPLLDPAVVSSVTAEELSFLETLSGTLDRRNLVLQARQARSLANKLRVLMPERLRRRLMIDAELVAQASGFALRPGPREILDQSTIGEILYGLRAPETIEVDYASGATAAARTHRLWPLGLLYGERSYLVATKPNPARPRPRLFRLSRIVRVERTGETFEAPDFDLQRYVERSFGIFQSRKRFRVALKFDPSVTEDLADYRFHPSQKTEAQPDGSTIMRFRASSLVEMCWEIFKWGRRVEILEPAELQEMYAAMTEGRWDRWDENEWE